MTIGLRTTRNRGKVISLADVRPLERVIGLSSLELSGPRLVTRRDKSGLLNLARLASPAMADPSATPPAPASAPASASTSASTSTSRLQSAEEPGAWHVQLEKLVLRDGQIAWADETTAVPVRLGLRELNVEASALAYPAQQPMLFSGMAVVHGPVSSPKDAALRFSGRATQREATLKASVEGLGLELAAPYVAQALRPTLGGTLGADVQLDWKAQEAAAKPGPPAALASAPPLTLQVSQLRLDHLALRDRGQALAGAAQLQITGARIDFARQSMAIGKVAVKQPVLLLERDADKRWMFASWRKAQASNAAPQEAAAPQPETSRNWALAVQEISVDDGSVSFQDAATAKPVAFAVSALKLQMKDVAADSAKPSSLTLSARIGARQAEPGSLAFQGQLNFGTLAAQGDVQARRIPVHAFEPYFADVVNIELLRADASFTGRVLYATGADGPTLRVSGNTAIEDFRANSLPGSGTAVGGGEELLSWKALSLRGLDIAMAPRKATSVDVQETVLSDFFSRLIVHENGRINLQDLLKPPAVAQAAATSATTAGAAALAPAQSDAVIRFGPVSLLNGKVHFSDRFVKPSYSADLSELSGKLSAFSSMPAQGTPQLADLELRGRAEGTASLEILGKLNPLAKPLALDIRGKVRDLELPALSPYAIKYAGHGIERGKLSLDVAYRVLPDGQLTATNNLVLHQLMFGEKIDGAPNSLPVKLAVALLADRNGVIDLDLPVSGSLNDPQFSIGPVIFKLIFNLIAKAITSPFSLLAGALGSGADELGTVVFAPGSAALTQPARASLEKVAKALADKPALKMTVVGTASLDAEREAYRRDRLRALVLAEKRRAAVLAGSATVAGTGAERAAAATVAVDDAEYLALLKEVYKRTDMPKPRNLIGLAKDLPRSDMEALLLVQIPVNEEAMRELAVQRGVAVRDYLAARQIGSERLFLGAAKAMAADAKWAPHAELSLAMP